jgi:hypothetical protein
MQRARASSLSEQPNLQSSLVCSLRSLSRGLVDEAIARATFFSKDVQKIRNSRHGISSSLLIPGLVGFSEDSAHESTLQPKKRGVNLAQVQWGKAETNVLHMQSKYTVQNMMTSAVLLHDESDRMISCMSTTEVTVPSFKTIHKNSSVDQALLHSSCFVATNCGVILCLKEEV